MFGKQLLHLLGCLHILLFRVEHSVGVADFFACTQTDQTLVSIGVFGFDEMYIVGGYHFGACFTGKSVYLLVHSLLVEVCLVAYLGTRGFV